MGDNDFGVEFTGVTVWQRAGTLERVVKYDEKAFTKAWDYLVSSTSDGKDGKQLGFLLHLFALLYMAFRGRIVFCQPSTRGVRGKKTKCTKHRGFQINYRLRRRTRLGSV